MSSPLLLWLHAWRARGQHRWLLLALVVASLLIGIVGIGLVVNLIDETSGLPGTVLAVTGDEPKADDKRPQFLATYRDGPPDMVMYSEGRHSGPLRYVTEEAARRIGYRIEWKHKSLSKSLPGLADGTVDIIPYVFYKAPEFEKDSRFSVSLGLQQRPSYFVINRRFGDHTTIKTMQDLAGHRVGYRENSSYFKEFHDAVDIVKVPFKNEDEMAQAFALGKVELMVLNNKQAMQRTIASVGFNDYEYTDLVFDMKSDMYYLFSKLESRAAVLTKLDAALQEMKDDGTIARIYKSFEVEPPL